MLHEGWLAKYPKAHSAWSIQGRREGPVEPRPRGQDWGRLTALGGVAGNVREGEVLG